MSVFDRNLVTGELTFVEVHQDELSGVDGLDVEGTINGQIYDLYQAFGVDILIDNDIITAPAVIPP